MTSPAELARRCFALASSTTHKGEREAAISRGTAIVDRHGLDPDQFDIPGRERKASRIRVTMVGLPIFNLDQIVAEAVRAAKDRMMTMTDEELDAAGLHPEAIYWLANGRLYCRHGPVTGPYCAKCEEGKD